MRGRDVAVKAVALMYQCADTTKIAPGLGTDLPNVSHAAVYRFCSSAFIGLTCPRKTAGIGQVLAARSLQGPSGSSFAASTNRRSGAEVRALLGK